MRKLFGGIVAALLFIGSANATSVSLTGAGIKNSGCSGNDTNTLSLLHFDGNLTDTNAGGAAHTWTANGTTTTTASPVKFGTGALANLFSATGANNIGTPYSTNFQPAAGNFTVDFWFQLTSTSAGTIVSSANNAGGISAWRIDYSGAVVSVFMSSNGTTANVCAACMTFTQSNDGLYHHVALIRTGSNFTLTQDGISKGTLSSAASLYDPGTGTENIGGLSGVLVSIAGDVDEFRYSNIDRWTTFPFTPPTAAYCP